MVTTHAKYRGREQSGVSRQWFGPGGGGATWFQLYPDVCVEKGRTWVPFRPQVSEMSDMISLRMGVNFAASLNMSGRLPQNCIS